MGSPQFRLRRSYLPYLLALLLMVLAGAWSARTGLIFDVKSGDGQGEYMPGRAFSAASLKAGSLPVWNPYIYTGFPHVGDIQNGIFYPPNLIFYLLLGPAAAYSASIVFNIFLTAFFTSQFLRLFIRSRYAVWIGAATFALCGFLSCNAVTVTIANSAAWVPAFFWCVEKWLRTRQWKYSAWAGLCLAMQLFAGWPQMVLLSVIYLGVYLIWSLPQQPRRVRIVVGLVVAGAIAVGLGLPQLIATLQLKDQSIIQHLGYSDYAFASVAPQLSILLFFPFLAGAGWQGVLWHKPYYAPITGQVNTYYVGIMPLILAVAALWLWRRSRYVRFAASIALLALLLAWGAYTPLGKILYHIPVYNFFHDHRINLIFFSFGVGVLAACGADAIALLELTRERRNRLGWLAPVIVIGTAALLLLHVKTLFRSMNPAVGAMLPDWLVRLHHVMRLDNIDMMLPIALLFFCGWLFWLWMRHPQSRRLAVFVVALIIADLLYFGLTFSWSTTEAGPSPDEQAALASMRDNAHGQEFRSLSLVKGSHPVISANQNEEFRHADILGLGPFLPRRHAALLNSLNVGDVRYWPELLLNNTVISMLNTRYIEMDPEQFKLLQQTLGPVHSTESSAAQPVPLSLGENLFAKPAWSITHGQRMIPPPGAIPPCVGNFDCENASVPLDLDPNSAYLLSFQARVDDARAPADKPADRNGYGGGFAGVGAGDFFSIAPWMLNGSREFNPYSQIYFTGANTKGLFFLLINFTRSPLELKDLSLRKIGSFPLQQNPYRLLGKFGDLYVLENPFVHPRAFFVSSVKPAASFTEARNEVWQSAPRFDARHTAIVEASPNELPTAVSEGTLFSLTYSPNRASAKVRCPATCFLVLSDIWYPDWHATIDGKPTPIYMTDAMVRGIVVPAGEHRVEFVYRSMALRIAVLLSLLTLGLVVLITVRTRGANEQSTRAN